MAFAPEPPGVVMRAPRTHGKPRSALENLVMVRARQAITDFGLIRPGDRVVVGVSGGPASFALLAALDLLARRRTPHCELLPVLVEKSAPPALLQQFQRQGYTVLCVEGENVQRTLRHWARTQGANRIALGHHLDDFLEALLTGLFFRGELGGLPIAEPGGLIRPLAYAESELLDAYCAERHFAPAGARQQKKSICLDVIEQIGRHYPRTRRSMLAALKHLRPGHLLDLRLPQTGAEASVLE